jgi:hypothetical protein
MWHVALRTVQRWEKGDFLIPEERKQELLGLLNSVNNSVREFMITLDKLGATTTDTIVLLAYTANNYDGDFPHYKLHNAVVTKAQERARNNNLNLRIVLFNPKNYYEWLKDRADTQATRSEWASFQIREA